VVVDISITPSETKPSPAAVLRWAAVPHKLPAAFLEGDKVLGIARTTATARCKEILFTLGVTGRRTGGLWSGCVLTEVGRLTPPHGSRARQWASGWAGWARPRRSAGPERP
jgi:hypothetical protein